MDKIIAWFKKFPYAVITLKDWVLDKYHEIHHDEKCGDDWFDPNEECCIDKQKIPRACSSEHIEITGPSDLILYKPAKDSPYIRLSLRGSDCPCPKAKNIRWSLSSGKVKFDGANNQATVRILPVAESEAENDISVTVTADGVTSAPKTLTVRRPKKMEHPALTPSTDQLDITLFKIALRTKGTFQWTLRDKWGKRLPLVPVSEKVTINEAASSKNFSWDDREFADITDIAGQIPDRYCIWADLEAAKKGDVHAVINQTLTAAGWSGTSVVNIITVMPYGVESAGQWLTITGTPAELQ